MQLVSFTFRGWSDAHNTSTFQRYEHLSFFKEDTDKHESKEVHEILQTFLKQSPMLCLYLMLTCVRADHINLSQVIFQKWRD